MSIRVKRGSDKFRGCHGDGDTVGRSIGYHGDGDTGGRSIGYLGDTGGSDKGKEQSPVTEVSTQGSIARSSDLSTLQSEITPRRLDDDFRMMVNPAFQPIAIGSPISTHSSPTPIEPRNPYYFHRSKTTFIFFFRRGLRRDIAYSILIIITR